MRWGLGAHRQPGGCAGVGWSHGQTGEQRRLSPAVLTAEGTGLGLRPKAHDTSQGGLGLQAVARISAFHQEPLGH